ncbi:hypothetical protein SLA2020_432050 [Shorea laevis]
MFVRYLSFHPLFSLQNLTSLLIFHQLYAEISHRTDRTGLFTAAPWIYFPYPFQWGSPTFHAGEAFAMIAASFVSLFESTGTFFATARYGSATPVPPSVISRAACWLGIGVLLNSMFGSVLALLHQWKMLVYWH